MVITAAGMAAAATAEATAAGATAAATRPAWAKAVAADQSRAALRRPRSLHLCTQTTGERREGGHTGSRYPIAKERRRRTLWEAGENTQQNRNLLRHAPPTAATEERRGSRCRDDKNSHVASFDY